MSVLLAEDNVTNQLVATQMLQKLGAAVDVASDGAIALERLSENSYDLLLVDIEMPRVSGLDVIRSVRSGGGDLAAAPIIALTAYAMQEHRQKITEAGADGLIPKPIISIDQFGADILAIVEDSRVRHAAPAAEAHPADEEEDRSPARQIDVAIFDNLTLSIGEEAMADLLAKIEVDLENVRRQITTAARRGDDAAMRAATHVLISVAGAVGGVRLQRKAERLNTLAHQGDRAAIAACAEEAIGDLDQVLLFIRDRIGSPEL